MYTKKPGNILFKLLITLALVALGGWLLYFNWLQRPIHYRTYDFSIEEAQRLRPFARAQYAHGLHAWFQNDPEAELYLPSLVFQGPADDPQKAIPQAAPLGDIYQYSIARG